MTTEIHPDASYSLSAFYRERADEQDERRSRVAAWAKARGLKAGLRNSGLPFIGMASCYELHMKGAQVGEFLREFDPPEHVAIVCIG